MYCLPSHRMLEAVLIIVCTTTAVSIAVMLLGTCVPVRNEDFRGNFDPGTDTLVYKQVSMYTLYIIYMYMYTYVHVYISYTCRIQSRRQEVMGSNPAQGSSVFL